MSARLISMEGSQVKIDLTIELSKSMIESEGKIQEGLNEAGCIATREGCDLHVIQLGEERKAVLI